MRVRNAFDDSAGVHASVITKLPHQSAGARDACVQCEPLRVIEKTTAGCQQACQQIAARATLQLELRSLVADVALTGHPQQAQDRQVFVGNEFWRRDQGAFDVVP